MAANNASFQLRAAEWSGLKISVATGGVGLLSLHATAPSSTAMAQIRVRTMLIVRSSPRRWAAL
jgi:hypothetical protein